MQTLSLNFNLIQLTTSSFPKINCNHTARSCQGVPYIGRGDTDCSCTPTPRVDSLLGDQVLSLMKRSMVWYSGVGFPTHRDLYMVYCTSPLNFKSAAIPSQRDSAARPTYHRMAEPPAGGIGNYVLGRIMTGNFAQRSPWGFRFFYVQ
jgi:hypothetical protein